MEPGERRSALQCNRRGDAAAPQFESVCAAAESGERARGCAHHACHGAAVSARSSVRGEPGGGAVHAGTHLVDGACHGGKCHRVERVPSATSRRAQLGVSLEPIGGEDNASVAHSGRLQLGRFPALFFEPIIDS